MRILGLTLLGAALACCAGWIYFAAPWDADGKQQQAQFEPSGDTLSLPDSCVLGQLGVTRNTPFVLFDGHYPDEWPAGLQLPFGFFNRGQGKLTVGDARPGDQHFDKVQKIEFKGVVRSSPDELVAYFRKNLTEAGLLISSDERSIGKELPGIGSDPGRIAITAKPAGSQATYPLFYVKVALLDDMGGWAYCTGHWIFGSYQLAEGEQLRRGPRDAEVVDAQGQVIGTAEEMGVADLKPES